LQVWNPGSEAGNAIADVVFGDYNPSGKLSITYPRNVGQIPVYYNYKNTGRPLPGPDWQKFVSAYLDVSNTPFLPFGYGLSYTSFEYGPVMLNRQSINANEKIEAIIKVKNTGQYDGEEVVQLYIRDMVAAITRPVKELKGFQKIVLKKGESRDIKFTISIDDLKYYNQEGKKVYEPGEFKLYIGTNSRDVKEASFILR
jgi:beta-glucosidase